jgi:hypothetical protein
MSSRSVTREFGHFLVKFEVDDSYYACPRIKVLTDGSQNRRDLQRSLGKVRRLQAKRKMPASNSNGPSKKQKAEANLLCIQEGTTLSDPYQFLPESPESPVLPFHLTATSPPPLTQTKETQTPSDLPAFLLNNTLSVILKQINVISTRQVQIDNMLVKQQQSIDNLTAAVLRQTTTSSANLSPPHTISTPIIRRQELPCTSTTSRQLQFPDTPSSSNATSSPIVATCSPHPRMDPVPRSFGPLPMHLFTDIDEQYRISENDLNSTNTAGNFATHLLRIIFAELFTSDNLFWWWQT